MRALESLGYRGPYSVGKYEDAELWYVRDRQGHPVSVPLESLDAALDMAMRMNAQQEGER